MISVPFSSIPDLRKPRRSARPLLAALAVLPVLAALVPTPAAADFRLCNRSGSRVGIALGYKDGEAWATEGWWNLAPKSCETLLRGDLVARFYYVYAVDYDQGGEWAGKAFMCTRDKEFTIRGIENCLARGFDRTGFFEVDTQEQKSWTVQLTEGAQKPTAQAGGAAGAPPLPPQKAP
ncbi:DUF1036 domain-containing protein [Ancylobacter oerskovii]|uniref:DUF1036 domain-containing protein n=1 Tax=Ancylobacter oerskovii TaxID=459519 RepID=A0ABW4YSJ8_9HYPH|nr:DUF1036 domain-containing protein [Ancylobacter oerskovii]MBS7545168.1 DUF1036 domain-containing protein [Ancylobacter oerskovii]